MLGRGFDLTNKTNMDLVWPIISNKESIAVNEAWVGDAGTLLKYSKEPRVQVPNCPHTGCPSPKCKPLPPGTPDSCHYPKWMIWKKEVAKGKVALLLINNDNGPQDISVAWSDHRKGCCTARQEDAQCVISTRTRTWRPPQRVTPPRGLQHMTPRSSWSPAAM